MYSHTLAALEKFDNQHDFERMGADILIALGYKEVVLIAPRGGSDGGRDITFQTESGGKGLACVTLRQDIDEKFKEDFSKRKVGEYEKYILFCRAHLTAQQKLKYTGHCLNKLQAEFLPQDIEVLRALLDNAFTSIRERYLGVKDLRLPQLKLGFLEDGQFVNEITRLTNPLWIWVTPEEYVQQELEWKQIQLVEILSKADSSVSEGEVEKFKAEYEKFLAAFPPALKIQFVKEHMPSCKFELGLMNDGTISATDVHIRIQFPRGSSSILLKNRDETIMIEEIVPEEPGTPKWALSKAELQLLKFSEDILAFSVGVQGLASFAESFRNMQRMGRPPFGPSTSIKLPYDSVTFPFGKNIFTKGKEKVGHHRSWELGAILLYLPPSAKKEVIISYTILADEFSDPISGELKIHWEAEASQVV